MFSTWIQMEIRVDHPRGYPRGFWEIYMDSQISTWIPKNRHAFEKEPHGLEKIHMGSQKSTWVPKNRHGFEKKPHGFEKIHIDSHMDSKNPHGFFQKFT